MHSLEIKQVRISFEYNIIMFSWSENKGQTEINSKALGCFWLIGNYKFIKFTIIGV